eukprot:UN12666
MIFYFFQHFLIMGISSSAKLEEIKVKDDELMIWLKQVGACYAIYHTIFSIHGYDDLKTLSLMNCSNERELIEIGIQKKGHKRRLLLEIKKLQEQIEGGRI